MSRFALATLLLTLLGGCTRRGETPADGAAAAQPGSVPAGMAQTPAGTTAAPLPLPPPPTLTAAAPPSRRQGPGDVMLGTWDITPTGVPAPHLTLTIEGAYGPDFHGRLTRAFAGDMELDLEVFRPLEGTVGPDSVARATIPMVPAGVPAVELGGTVRGGVWTLSSFVWGGDQQVQPGVTWTGRKVR